MSTLIQDQQDMYSRSTELARNYIDPDGSERDLPTGPELADRIRNDVRALGIPKERQARFLRAVYGEVSYNAQVRMRVLSRSRVYGQDDPEDIETRARLDALYWWSRAAWTTLTDLEALGQATL